MEAETGALVKARRKQGAAGRRGEQPTHPAVDPAC